MVFCYPCSLTWRYRYRGSRNGPHQHTMESSSSRQKVGGKFLATTSPFSLAGLKAGILEVGQGVGIDGGEFSRFRPRSHVGWGSQVAPRALGSLFAVVGE